MQVMCLCLTSVAGDIHSLGIPEVQEDGVLVSGSKAYGSNHLYVCFLLLPLFLLLFLSMYLSSPNSIVL